MLILIYVQRNKLTACHYKHYGCCFVDKLCIYSVHMYSTVHTIITVYIVIIVHTCGNSDVNKKN